MRARIVIVLIGIIGLLPGAALGGPPYISDDPVPTDYRHFEIYLFASGVHTRDGVTGSVGVDFNYGAAPDLQLTAVVPIAYENVSGSGAIGGFGNVELAAKYRIFHQSAVGLDIAIFPRVILPSPSPHIGERRGSILLPVWFGRDWGRWSTFGGGGCAIHRGSDAKDYCLMGWAITRQLTSSLRVGLEFVHRTVDTRDGHVSTGVGAGLTYDINETCHVLASIGPGLQNAAKTNRVSWYSALLFTF